jgi:hypothetical protein
LWDIERCEIAELMEFPFPGGVSWQRDPEIAHLLIILLVAPWANQSADSPVWPSRLGFPQ